MYVNKQSNIAYLIILIRIIYIMMIVEQINKSAALGTTGQFLASHPQFHHLNSRQISSLVLFFLNELGGAEVLMNDLRMIEHMKE